MTRKSLISLLILLLFCLSVFAQIPDLIPYRYGAKWGFCDSDYNIQIPVQFDHVNPFNEEYASVMLHNKFGIIDRKGKVVIPVSYDYLSFSDDFPDLIYALNDKKNGYINLKNEIIIPIVYDGIYQYDKPHRKIVEYRGKKGLIDIKKGVLCEPLYDELRSANNGVSVIKSDNKYGLINPEGRVLQPPVFDYIFDFEKGPLSFYQISNKYGFINNQGVKTTEARYDLVWYFENANAKVQSGNKFGMVNSSGIEILSPEYDFVYADKEGYITVRKDNKYALVNHKGSLITGFDYDGLWGIKNGLAKVSKEGKWGFINTKGKVVIPFSYSNTGQFSDGLIWVVIDNKVGYIDQKGKTIIEPSYSFASDFNNGLAKVRLDNKYGYINKKGEFVINAEYDSVGDFKDGMATIFIGKKVGCIDVNGKVLLRPVYDDFFESTGNQRYWDVELNKKHGIYRKDGTKILDPEFENTDFSKGCFLVKKDGLKGLYDTNGTLIAPCIYKSISTFSMPYFVAEKEGVQGLMDEKGKIVFPLIYEEVKCNNPTILFAKKDDKWGCLDMQNKVLVPFEYYSCRSFRNGLGQLQSSFSDDWVYVDINGHVFDKKFVVPEGYKPDLPILTKADIEVRKIKSEVINDEFSLLISLPPGYYQTNKTYPVIYLLDADYQLGIVSEANLMMSFAQEIPECIIVGIAYQKTFDDWYAKRIRDMCPTAKDYPAFPGGGGAENFMNFIEKDIIPLIEKNYRVAGDDRTFTGYSLGGLFGTYVLFKKPQLFKKYLLISPSIWWDDQIVLNYEQDFLKSTNEIAAKVFISSGEKDAFGVIDGSKALNEKLKKSAYRNLNWKYEVMSGQTHFSTFPEAYVKGIKWLFSN